MKDDVNASAPPRRARHFLALFACLTLALNACVTPRKKADAAFEQGQYEEALELYQAEIDGGSKDPQVYYMAAQASLKQGDFAGAERLYSRSIRYGGGVPVMRALAELYIQTSNYTRAVRVLMELLDLDEDQQPIYNNLGTALMYADRILDAESYLLIAQQMDPSDPLPYLNLGVLYDRYMRRPQLGADFYRCYLRMTSSGAVQRRTILMRLRELKLSPEEAPELVTCGEVYRPRAPTPPDDLREALGVGAEEAGQEGSPAGPVDLGLGEGAEGGDTPIVEDSGGAAPPEVDPGAGEQPDGPALARQRARQAYRDKDYERALRTLEVLEDEDLVAADHRLMARCHEALGAPSEAEVRWRMALSKEPDASALGALIKLLEGQRRHRDILELCEAYRDEREVFDPVRHLCNAAKARVK